MWPSIVVSGTRYDSHTTGGCVIVSTANKIPPFRWLKESPLRDIAKVLAYLCLPVSAPVAVVPFQPPTPQKQTHPNRDRLRHPDGKEVPPGRLPVPLQHPHPDVVEGCSGAGLHALQGVPAAAVRAGLKPRGHCAPLAWYRFWQIQQLQCGRLKRV